MSDDLDVRRPDLEGVERTNSGIVAEGYRALEADQRVRFAWHGDVVAHGRHRAVDVRILG